MTALEECYARLGSDGAEAARRVGGEGRLLKVLAVAMRDNSMDALRTALADGDREAAFAAAHTLKGMFANLGFDKLAAADAALVEALREGSAHEAAAPLFEEVDRLEREMRAEVQALLEAPAQEGAGR